MRKKCCTFCSSRPSSPECRASKGILRFHEGGIRWPREAQFTKNGGPGGIDLLWTSVPAECAARRLKLPATSGFGSQTHASQEFLTHPVKPTAQSSETCRTGLLADREGFEPSVRLPLRLFSKEVLSTAQPPIRCLRGSVQSQSNGVVNHLAAFSFDGLQRAEIQSMLRP